MESERFLKLPRVETSTQAVRGASDETELLC